MSTINTTADLYREVRGKGPAVLFITGATGDAGQFRRTAEALADEFTIITYDRRGNSRSRAGSEDPASATMAAQADDAAALIRDCGIDRAVAFGTSGGAIITLSLIARHPEVVRAAIVHEPPLMGLLPPAEGPNPFAPIFQLAQTDPGAAVELFISGQVSAQAWADLEPDTRERMRGNGDTLFGREFEQFVTNDPDTDAIRASRVPVDFLHSTDGLPVAGLIESILIERLGGPSATITGNQAVTGHHAPYLNTPDLFAEELRPILRRLAAPVEAG
ncbi:alpha/beta hydrolase [Raineyella sp. LH-20]|uniref:alpha/beta fold hydrolase n=1 Tax=Raineyella sp. LH-20 TaxID=3081204 RepID=UPI002954EC31|nr:alpha/beta hydrolase [Raineyella sp. LH-20]WOP17831.1 alpha/beta hydrolase [Raineyella sp. LH-20]